MSAEVITGRQKAEFIEQQIISLENALAKMLSNDNVIASAGMPSSNMLARGLIINRLMYRARQDHGPDGVKFLNGMYRDFCGIDEGSAA